MPRQEQTFISKRDFFPPSIICGLDRNTTKADLVRAAMEAVCFQTKDILDALKLDFDRPIQKIFADGGMTVNSCFMQLQADIAGIPIGKF